MSQRALSTARVLVFDTETTGTRVLEDRVVELGAAYFEAGVRTRTHCMRVNPGCPIPPEATAVHGIGDADVATAPGFAAVGARFAAHLTGEVLDGVAPVLSGYNACLYDAPLLNAEFARHGLDARIDPARVVDPLVFMKWHHRDLRSRKLVDACEYYGISLRDAHSAAADSVATGELLAAMVRAGLVPDDLEICLVEQAEKAVHIEREFGQWRSWLYGDRQTGELRIGAGKHVGRRPEEVEPDWFQYILQQIDDLPPAVREVFTRYA